MAYQPVTHDILERAKDVIRATYGHSISVPAKAKFLNKFGQNLTVGTSFETVAALQGTEANETFVSSNIIDSIASSSGSDTTQTITIEGHTVDGSGNLTFVTQDVALTGQTEATLGTPLARANRAYVKVTGTAQTYPAALVGNVHIYDNTGGVSSGTPTVPAATKLMILAGDAQSEKCATSISSTDYWLLTQFEVGVGVAGGAANRVRARIERRDVKNGGAWRPLGTDIVIVVGGPSVFLSFDPVLIIPPNHDVRVRAVCNSNTASVFAEMNGYLASIQ